MSGSNRSVGSNGSGAGSRGRSRSRSRSPQGLRGSVTPTGRFRQSFSPARSPRYDNPLNIYTPSDSNTPSQYALVTVTHHPNMP